MALTREEFTGNGVIGANNASTSDRLNYSFIPLKNEDIKVKLNGVLIAPDKYTFHTTPTTAITFNSINPETTLQLTTGAPKTGVSILIYRDTDISSAKNSFSVGSSIRADDLNDNQKQAIFAVKEVKDLVDDDLVRSTDTWSTNDTEIASTAAINDRIAGLGWDTTQLNSRIDTRADQRIASSAIAITTVQTAANESAHLALTTQEGDVVVRTDQTKSYVRNSGTAGTMADFTELLSPTGAVTSVNTNTGAITADQIAAAVETASDSNTFTDADHTKLNNIEANATADQTDAEIRAAVEAASDSNVFTDADHTKLNGIEASATADQTDAEIKTAYENNSDTNAFTDAEKTKLSNIEANATADQTDEEIQDVVGAMLTGNTETGITVTYEDADGTIDFVVASQTDENFTTADHNKLDGIESGATADQTGSEIKSLYEGESDTNAFTDAEKTKLAGIEASADVTDTANVKSALESLTSSVIIPDNIAIRFGADSNLRIFHDANDDWSYVRETDDEAEGLRIQGQNLVLEDNSGDNYILCEHDGPVTLYYDAASRLITRSYGVEVRGDGSSQDGAIQLNCSQNSHGVKIQAPPHSANASYTLVLPTTDGSANQVLKSDGSGNLDWVDQTAAYTNASVDAHLNQSTASTNEVLSWNGSDYAWVAQSGGGGGSAITVQDEGSALATAATTLNFVGAGVTATGSGSTKTITISGGGGGGSGVSQAKATALALIF